MPKSIELAPKTCMHLNVDLAQSEVASQLVPNCPMRQTLSEKNLLCEKSRRFSLQWNNLY